MLRVDDFTWLWWMMKQHQRTNTGQQPTWYTFWLLNKATTTTTQLQRQNPITQFQFDYDRRRPYIHQWRKTYALSTTWRPKCLTLYRWYPSNQRFVLLLSRLSFCCRVADDGTRVELVPSLHKLERILVSSSQKIEKSKYHDDDDDTQIDKDDTHFVSLDSVLLSSCRDVVVLL